MNFLMEAAKHQDEVKRLKPVEDLKGIITEFLQVEGVVAAAVLFNQTVAEIYGESRAEGVPRAALAAGMVNANNALRSALSDTGNVSGMYEMLATFPECKVLAVPLLENRFSAVLCLGGAADVTKAKELFTVKQGALINILREYETQFDLQNGSGIDPLNPDDLEKVFSESF